MVKIRHACQQLYREPLTWIFYCFFQPTKFKRDIEVQGFAKRLLHMCKMALPLFTLSYPLALCARFLLYYFFPQLYAHYFHSIFSPNTIDLISFIFDATWALLLGIGAALPFGALFGLSYGISGGIVAGFWGGVAVQTRLGAPGYVAVAITVVTMLGLGIGIAIGSARDITNSSGVSTGIGSVVGLMLGIPSGLPFGAAAAYVGGVTVYSRFPGSHLTKSVVGSTLGALLGTAFGAIITNIIVGIIRGSLRTKILNSGIERALSVSTASCIAVSTIMGGVMGTAFGGLGEAGFAIGLGHYILPNILVIPVFVISYMLGYYRLPLYLFSGPSSIRAYFASRSNPPKVFDYLRRSSLYWDESVFLSLPCLKRTLYCALEQNSELTLKEIAFIVTERPSQLTEVRPVTREMAIRDLETRKKDLQLIAQASERLAEIIPQEAKLIDPRWQLPFIRLDDASREAARYCTPLGRQARRDALRQMIVHLERVPKRAFEDLELNIRLNTVVEHWLAAAENGLSKLEFAPEEIGHIDNPYICGPALKANTGQFVGRRDLIRQLEQALSRGAYCPSFLLTGERRMGKTSTLNQLPFLLGARYLPIIFDLQLRGISSNVAAFLVEIADAIRATMDLRGMRINKLEYVVLNEARRENEASVYRHFDTWFKQVETLLEQEDRTILLAFDEFEKLEEAGQAHYLELNLLLDWFRSTVQNHSRLALLFSGVKTLSQMRTNWSGYFVNVKTLRVTFLHPTDAFRLITQPTNDYPSEGIFGEGVVEEIMRVTGNHPFLIQAVCSELIETLNVELREQASLEDVATAVEYMFEHWEDAYFFDLWSRTTAEQRKCLHVLQLLRKATIQQVVEQTQMDEQIVQDTLQALRRRDLILPVDDFYQLAAPIFSEWVWRNS